MSHIAWGTMPVSFSHAVDGYTKGSECVSLGKEWPNFTVAWGRGVDQKDNACTILTEELYPRASQ